MLDRTGDVAFRRGGGGCPQNWWAQKWVLSISWGHTLPTGWCGAVQAVWVLPALVPALSHAAMPVLIRAAVPAPKRSSSSRRVPSDHVAVRYAGCKWHSALLVAQGFDL